MLSHATYILVSCLLTLVTAIRVDWNTNKGPIVPPTPRTTVRPLPPYREPAPVWEDQSNDIPNPNPYVYILPPPSRPRPATNNYLTSDYYNNNKNENSNYGNVIAPADINSYLQHGNANVVGTLSAQYTPSVGIRYTAVVPSVNNVAANALPVNNVNVAATGNVDAGYRFSSGAKLQGKYNAKTKKYKAYEKVKYVPHNYYPLYDFALPEERPYEPIFDQEQLIRTQQLPLVQAAPSFRSPLEIALPSTTQQTTVQKAKITDTKVATEKSPKSKEKSSKKQQTSANSIFSEKRS